ncbi:MAG: acetyl-CoA carboxylase carboxyltransferase subunit, partial [Leptospiraceae bacterium]|nr:acetyl-CoA carboxylase carboxyltransferase subunit [Leptospiraceae bacterium]
SAVASGQIDIDAAYKGARFTRFCNLYNIPVIFFEDTTGFLPGKEQESGGIVQAGRALLDSIIDLRVPRFLVIVRNAFGGAYATWNSYHVGADMVFTLPTARVAVMGPAGKEFVYKKEMQEMRKQAKALEAQGKSEEARDLINRISKELTDRYEADLMNPKEALSLGSISRVMMPGESRKLLAQNLGFYMDHYKPSAMTGPQREFH